MKGKRYFTQRDRQILQGGKYYYKEKRTSFGLSTYIVIPKNKLYIDIEPGFRLAWFVALSSFVGVFVVIFFISRTLTKPLHTIIGKMKEVGRGDFATRLENYDLLEFQEISDSFNDMTDKIDHLIKEVYEAQLLAKEARIQYLQAQINPHFMFNVLSMISIRLQMKKDKEIYPLVNAFAGLMQGKLFRKNEIEIPLREEMEIASFYLYLSGERFKNFVTYEIIWEDESLKDCMIPKLCIEPIIENAMIHGLEPKKEKGYIRVHIRLTPQKDLCIRIEDDGVGFNMEEVMTSEERKTPRVGIMNIQRLIHNLYGEKYGVHIQSQINQGTVVKVYLPFSKERQV